MRDDDGVGEPDGPGEDGSPDRPAPDRPGGSESDEEVVEHGDEDTAHPESDSDAPTEGGGGAAERARGEARTNDGAVPADRVAGEGGAADDRGGRTADDRGGRGAGKRGGAVAGEARRDAGRERPAGSNDGTAEGPGWALYLYDLVSSVAVVVLIGGLLFAASGVWPPMVAVESGSMEPTMEKGDLVYVMESERFPGAGAQDDTGVVTAEQGRATDYRQFGGYGDVIVYQPDGSEGRTPIIHRAMLYVEEGERWVDRANPAYLRGADSCADLPDDVCPAPHAGFITKGDANGGYDQVSGIVDRPVRPEWVIGTAEVHVPYLGQIRLGSSGLGSQNATAAAGAVRTVP